MLPHDCVPLPDYRELEPPVMLQRAEHFLAIMRQRHTVRDFSPRPVDRRVIEAAILTAGTAPSGANHQPWFFGVIGSSGVKRELRRLAEEEERGFYAGRAGEEWLGALRPLGTDHQKPYLETAPWIIAVFGQRRGGIGNDGTSKNYYMPESVGIAMGLLISSLHQSGLAMLTHTPKPMDFLNDLCGRPREERPYLLLVCGYPAEGATIPTHALLKKSFDEICSFV